MRGVERERAILAATLELVGELGYEGVTMDAVAGRARASKATIYRRWRDKPELVKAALQAYDSGRAVACPDTGSLRGDLLAALHAIRGQLTDEHLALMSGLAHAMRHDSGLAVALRPQLAEDEPLPTIVERAIARGELPAGASSAVAHEVIEGQIFRQMLINEPIDAAFLEHLTDDLLLPLLSR